jgi:hypothetical protein
MTDTPATVEPADEYVPSIFETCETDTDAEEAGKWFDEVFPGASFKIRRGISKTAIKARQAALRRYQKHAKNGVFSEEIQKQILVDVLVDGVLVDWRGKAMRDESGPLQFSREVARAMLMRLPNLRVAIATISDNMDNFRVEADGAIAGNSQAS